MNNFKTIVFLLNLAPALVLAQGMKMSEKIVLSQGSRNNALSVVEFKNKAMDIIASKGKVQTIHLFHADRGNKKGEFLLVADNNNVSGGSDISDPFSSFTGIINDAGSFTTYQLIGADKFGPLPNTGILGIHYIKVRPEKAQEFEKFVTEKLHPQLGHVFPDMQMMYYKALAGNKKADFILVFSIASPAARDKYWPEGKPETDLLKDRFKQFNALAAELEPFLIPDTYLETKSGGAAAIFESKVWTDFVHHSFLK